MDRVLDLAKNHDIVIFLGVPGINGTTTADGSARAFTANGAAKAAEFGKYLGNRYRNQENLVWVIGNDYSGWNTPADRVIRAFMEGVSAGDTGHHPMTAELYPTPKLSWDAPKYRSRIQLNATTVNMTKMAGPTTAKWFNPSTGVYTTIADSPLPNTGSQVFTPPGTGCWCWKPRLTPNDRRKERTS